MKHLFEINLYQREYCLDNEMQFAAEIQFYLEQKYNTSWNRLSNRLIDDYHLFVVCEKFKPLTNHLKFTKNFIRQMGYLKPNRKITQTFDNLKVMNTNQPDDLLTNILGKCDILGLKYKKYSSFYRVEGGYSFYRVEGGKLIIEAKTGDKTYPGLITLLGNEKAAKLKDGTHINDYLKFVEPFGKSGRTRKQFDTRNKTDNEILEILVTLKNILVRDK